jgi:hypothetical protein
VSSGDQVVNRREFSANAAATLVSAVLPPFVVSPQPGKNDLSISSAAAELYVRALVLDSNSAPLG